MEHPAAKSMIEIARTQDEEVGDGTTSVIILGKKMPNDSLPHLMLFCYRKAGCQCFVI